MDFLHFFELCFSSNRLELKKYDSAYPKINP
jgi:hypothetical protein